MTYPGIEQMTKQLGISLWVFVVILAWTAFWKLFGLWKSARNGSVVWFILIALINTVGILPIVYIYVISRMKAQKIHSGSKNKKSKKSSASDKK